MSLNYYNSISNSIEKENVYGAQLVDWLYTTSSGKLLSTILCKAPLSKMYGYYQDSFLSKSQINQFIEQYKINMGDFLPDETGTLENPYANFNQFFIRRLRPGKRNFSLESNELGAFAEARYYGYAHLTEKEKVPVKGQFLSAKNLLNNEKWSSTFKDGPLLLARLCPVDYHRFHYPDDGTILDSYPVKGLYHSVNPLAIKAKNDIYMTNERFVTILDTKNFGKLAYIEVGAICVGKIVPSRPLINGDEFKRGDEKGYFKFGGSTVIVLGERGKWVPQDLLLKNTHSNIETYYQLGMSVAVSK